MDTHYVVVFDAAEAGYRQWWFPAFGLIFVALGLLCVFATRRSSVSRARLSARLFTGFAMLWVTTTAVSTLTDYYSLRNALRDGNYVVVEGPVTDFTSAPKLESFHVGDHIYQYSDSNVTAAFNNMSSHGGPVRAGLRVRIADVQGDIARLEIAR